MCNCYERCEVLEYMYIYMCVWICVINVRYVLWLECDTWINIMKNGDYVIWWKTCNLPLSWNYVNYYMCNEKLHDMGIVYATCDTGWQTAKKIWKINDMCHMIDCALHRSKGAVNCLF